MKSRTTFILTLFALNTYAAIYEVGPSQPYVSPNALYQAGVVQDGDTIQIDGADYFGQETLAYWTADRLLILGVNGTPHLHADGEYILGKGIWVFGGDDITVENIEFSGAVVPDKNGAGIRLDGVGVTVRNCNFHDNETGILTNSPYEGHILVEYTEFGHNGNGDGFSHNIYVNHADTLTFQYNYTHHATIGHCIKSRADYNFIRYNRIMDEDDGRSSRLIDIPNGGQCVILGNTMMQGTNAENFNMIGYGLEGLINEAPHKVYIVNNTMVSTRSNSLFFHIQEGTELAYTANNILAGAGTIVDGELSFELVNAMYDDIATIGFVDVDNYDYRLTEGAAPANLGLAVGVVDGIDLDVEYEYVHPISNTVRLISNTIDIGAFELEESSINIELQQHEIVIFPNPAHEVIHFTQPIDSVIIMDISGKIVFRSKEMIEDIDIAHYSPGIYNIFSDNQVISRIVIK